jgi:hypothetical protein
LIRRSTAHGKVIVVDDDIDITPVRDGLLDRLSLPKTLYALIFLTFLPGGR